MFPALNPRFFCLLSSLRWQYLNFSMLKLLYLHKYKILTNFELFYPIVTIFVLCCPMVRVLSLYWNENHTPCRYSNDSHLQLACCKNSCPCQLDSDHSCLWSLTHVKNSCPLRALRWRFLSLGDLTVHSPLLSPADLMLIIPVPLPKTLFVYNSCPTPTNPLCWIFLSPVSLMLTISHKQCG